ncbi:DUF1963 domain-containing protein [Tropicibacter oceani]|uniref:DUF1963 domain-containing protein n=1 Tax=Tropicibacter oceani TaxID=3058420 RepID=A0ABY8QL32_9RHOB|nr:DUF1963 domain-containing protein [Tropicibacter oceani]WGW05158.1 DUF1963 domain-containing protein [Tropicibacter oceani]
MKDRHMVYAARSVFLLGTGIMGFGLLWAIAIWKDAVAFLPGFWDQPVTAVVLMAVGFAICSLGKKMGGDVFGDASPIAQIQADLARFVPQRWRGGVVQDAASNKDRFGAYGDMIEDAPAEYHQPGRPALKARQSLQDIPAEAKSEVIAALLRGGVKAVEDMPPMRPVSGAAVSPPPAPRADVSPPPPAAPLTDFRTGRIRLQVALPQRQTRSWIGGGPSLPEAMDWPMIDGRPASFYAQIALGDLPQGIWGGIGPRDGWLIFFGADDPGARAIVLHSPERGVDRVPPAEADYYFKGHSGEEALAEMIGPEALQPPRWYLETVQDDGGARPDLAVRSPVASLLVKPTMTDPGLLPFDWPTAFALLDSADAMVQRMIARATDRAEQGNGAALAQAEAMTDVLTRLRLIARRFEARAEAAPFDEKACARLIGALAKTTNAGWLSAKARAEGKKPISLLQFQGYAPYRKLYEAQARRVYCEGGALPEATLARLLPLWQAQAAVEAIFVGNAPNEALPQDAPCLLVLPSSELTGWQIGDLSRWAVQITPEALAQGRFNAAVSQNSHGQDWDS